LAKAHTYNADALILDLEDSVADSNKTRARELTSEFLRARSRGRGAELWVRINALPTVHAMQDLAAVVPAAPDGIVLPKPDSAADAIRLDHYLHALEVAAGLEVGRIRILPIATETPKALFALNGYAGSTARLIGLTWGAEDLPAGLGALANRDENRNHSDVCRLARTLCLAGAGAAEVPAIDTVYTAFRDCEGLLRFAGQARRDGFAGMLAIHPSQVAVINDTFTPTEAELERARRIIAAFESDPTSGTFALDGEMVDAPHLKRARRTVAFDKDRSVAGGVVSTKI
jgi:citrate lyase subunit beta/citryl-CoA lyase